VSLLDPGDRAYADEQEHDAGSDRGEGTVAPEVLEGQIAGVDPDPNADAPGCRHPAADRRLVEGEQVCTVCWEVIESEQQIVPRDRPGSEDPTIRPASDGQRPVGLQHVTYDPTAQYAHRPYTPEEVELEITRILAKLEVGAGFLTTKEEERAAAKIEYELRHARARFDSRGRSAEQREDDALLQCRHEYERWQLLELQCKTAREGMHNYRSMLSGFQSVLRSASTVAGNYR
jgi:hypothetical protein